MNKDEKNNNYTAIAVAIIAGVFTLLVAMVNTGMFKSKANIIPDIDSSKVSKPSSNFTQKDSSTKYANKPSSNFTQKDSSTKHINKPLKTKHQSLNRKISLTGVWDYTVNWPSKPNFVKVHGQMIVCKSSAKSGLI